MKSTGHFSFAASSIFLNFPLFCHPTALPAVLPDWVLSCNLGRSKILVFMIMINSLVFGHFFKASTYLVVGAL